MNELETLFDAYLANELQDEKLAELVELLKSDPDARRRFLQFALLDAQLSESFLEEEEQGEQDSPISSASREQVRRREPRFWAAIVAVVAALVVASIWLVWPSKEHSAHEILAGQILVDGKERDWGDLLPGSEIRVTGNDSAEIKLDDGSQVELESSSLAVLHGELDGIRQVVELVEGSGTFQVRKGEKQFQVRTSIGDVTVLGTEFSVRLFSPHLEKVDYEMKKELLMAVVVFSGTVVVNFDGAAHTLVAGDNQVFGQDAQSAPSSTDNTLLTQMSEFFGLTAEQRKAFPEAEAKYKKAYKDFDYSGQRNQLRADQRAGQLTAEQYSDAKNSLRQQRDEILMGVGTLSEILTDEQKADWDTFQQYRMIVPSLRRKGVQFTDQQIVSIRKLSKEAADRLRAQTPREARYARWSTLAELSKKVRSEVLTDEQRAVLEQKNDR